MATQALTSIAPHLRRRIVEWLNQPVQPHTDPESACPMNEALTLRMRADVVRRLGGLAREAEMKRRELEEFLVMREAESKSI